MAVCARADKATNSAPARGFAAVAGDELNLAIQRRFVAKVVSADGLHQLPDGKALHAFTSFSARSMTFWHSVS